MKPTYNGFRYEAPLRGRDYFEDELKLGAAVVNPSADWTDYLPEYEAQNKGYEPNACVSFSVLSSVEMYLNLILAPQGKRLAEGWSDRFLATVAGTDPNRGATFRQVLDALRRYGVPVEDKWPYDAENYYAAPPPSLFGEARKDFKEVWEVKYEEVSVDQIPIMLQFSPLLASFSAWFKGEDGIYTDMGVPNNHAAVIVKSFGPSDVLAFDTYDDPLKRYRGLIQQVKRISVGPATVKTNPFITAFFGFLEWLGLRSIPVDEKKATEVIKIITDSEPLPPPYIESPAEKLFAISKDSLGKDWTPNDNVPDEVACIEHGFTILRKLYPDLPILTYTTTAKAFFDKDPRFEQTDKLAPGHIWISITDDGYKDEKGVPMYKGHMGIQHKIGYIASNDSPTGKWLENFTDASWIQRFRKLAGKKIYVYRPIAQLGALKAN